MKRDKDPLRVLNSATRKVESLQEKVFSIIERKEELRLRELQELQSVLRQFADSLQHEIEDFHKGFGVMGVNSMTS